MSENAEGNESTVEVIEEIAPGIDTLAVAEMIAGHLDGEYDDELSIFTAAHATVAETGRIVLSVDVEDVTGKSRSFRFLGGEVTR